MSSRQPGMPPFTVIVADDDDRVVEALTNLIDDHPSLQVIGSAHSGSEAAAVCAALRPKIAVIDVVMPGGGVEAVEAIHQTSPSTIVVAYTARRDRLTRERLLAVGAAAVFHKGLTLELAASLYDVARRSWNGGSRTAGTPGGEQ